MSKPDLSESMSEAAHTDAELDANLNRVSLGIDRLADQRDRLQAENAALVAALRDLLTDANEYTLANRYQGWFIGTEPIEAARAALAAHDAMGLPIPTGE